MMLLRLLFGALAAFAIATPAAAEDLAPLPGNELMPQDRPYNYLDKDSITSRGSMQRFWYVQDRPGKGSKRLHWELNCSEHQWRLLEFADYRGQMGKGERVGGSDPTKVGEFRAMVRGDSTDFLIKEVCTRPRMYRYLAMGSAAVGVAFVVWYLVLWRRKSRGQPA